MALPSNDPTAAERRVFTIAVANVQLRDSYDALIVRDFMGSRVFQSVDGPDLLRKIENVPPQVVVLDADIARIPLEKVLKSLFEFGVKAKPISVVVLGELPKQQEFLDEVATGQLQYVGRSPEPELFLKACSRAINFQDRDSDADFFLRHLMTGDCLIKQGEKGKSVFIVKKGTLNAVMVNGDQKVVIGSIEAGEFVGEMAFINGEPRVCDVIAASTCELIEIPFDHFDHLIFRKPAWSKALMKTLSKRVKLNNSKKISEA